MKKNLTYKELSSVTYVSPDGLVTHTDKKIVFEKGRGMWLVLRACVRVRKLDEW